MAIPVANLPAQCDLKYLLITKGWGIDEAAEALGDSALRLYRVLEGQEPLGKTATLAALALKYDLPSLN